MKKANGLLDALTHRVTNVSHALYRLVEKEVEILGNTSLR